MNDLKIRGDALKKEMKGGGGEGSRLESERRGRGGGWRTLQKGDQEGDITVVGQG